jgi:hypothetical protein
VVAVYVTADGLARLPELAGVSVTVPAEVGVIVKVCAAAELLNVSTIGVDSPPPLGVRVMVPVYSPLGVAVKVPDTDPTLPLAGAGGVSVNEVAAALLAV